MISRTVGPLETELFAIKNRHMRADPVLDGLLTGRLTTADLAALQTTSLEQFGALILRALAAYDEIFQRLAQEIDAINAAGV